MKVQGEKNRPCAKWHEVKNKKRLEQGVIKTSISVFMEIVSEKGTIKTTCPKWSSTCPKWSSTCPRCLYLSLK
jgi:hypothetical protein